MKILISKYCSILKGTAARWRNGRFQRRGRKSTRQTWNVFGQKVKEVLKTKKGISKGHKSQPKETFYWQKLQQLTM